MHKKSLLSATFEESQKIVSKKILTEDGAQIGLMSSMKFQNRLLALVIGLFVVGLIFSIGVGLPKFIVLDRGKSSVLSDDTIGMISFMGSYLMNSIEILLGLYLILLVLNIFPKPNYAFQLAYGNIAVFCLVLLAVVSFLPFTLGLTIGAFGWLGFVLQLLACLYLWKSMVLSSIDQLKTQLYKGKSEGKDWGERILLFIKKYGGILLLVSIVNRWTINFGEIVTDRPSIFSFLYGWSFLLVAGFMIFALGMTLKQFVKAFYFFKYRNEYRQYFKISDELWYGKWRAKLKSKFRK